MQRLFLGLVLLMAVALAFFAMELRHPPASETPEVAQVSQATQAQNGFQVIVNLPKVRFKAGETIPIAIYAKNTSPEAATIFFMTSQKYDINIKNAAGVEVWSWAKGRVFTMAIEQMQFAPGKQAAFSYLWDQTASDGTKVPPGRYLIEALCTSKQTPIPAAVNIEVVP